MNQRQFHFCVVFKNKDENKHPSTISNGGDYPMDQVSNSEKHFCQMHDRLDVLPDLKWSFPFCLRCFVHYEAISVYTTLVKTWDTTHNPNSYFRIFYWYGLCPARYNQPKCIPVLSTESWRTSLHHFVVTVSIAKRWIVFFVQENKASKQDR